MGQWNNVPRLHWRHLESLLHNTSTSLHHRFFQRRPCGYTHSSSRCALHSWGIAYYRPKPHFASPSPASQFLGCTRCRIDQHAHSNGSSKMRHHSWGNASLPGSPLAAALVCTSSCNAGILSPWRLVPSPRSACTWPKSQALPALIFHPLSKPLRTPPFHGGCTEGRGCGLIGHVLQSTCQYTPCSSHDLGLGIPEKSHAPSAAGWRDRSCIGTEV